MSVAIGVTAVVAAALSGCSSSPDYNAVCIDDKTKQRVDDYQCDNDYYGGYRWYYIGGGRRLPSVGSRVYGGSTEPPAGSVGRGGGTGSGGSHSGSSSHEYGGFGGHSSGIGS